jgi:hypothetical protein
MRTRASALVFALTLALSGGLLFTVQPMVARQLLPWLGGSPSVWITAQLFFQAALLAGYLYAHQLGRLAFGAQLLVHAALLASAFLVLPIDPVGTAADATMTFPQSWLLRRLLLGVGLPFAGMAATAPLLQSWFAARRDVPVDPYPLYVASNLGSLAALLAYPLLIEPSFPLRDQSFGWSIGFALLTASVIGCGLMTLRRAGHPALATHQEFALGEWLGWTALAFVPSSLMLGATLFLTTDIAPVPLLWVVPLGLYLGSFVLAFARRPLVAGGRVASWFALAVSLLVPVLLAGWTWSVFVPLHLLTFFLAAWMVHAEVARRRPPPERLTGFYLALASGGVLGGVFNALVAPFVFDRVAEYPIGLILACLAAAFVGGRPATTWRRSVVLPAVVLALLTVLFANPGDLAADAWAVPLVILGSGLGLLIAWKARSEPLRFALGVGSVLLASALLPSLGGEVIHRERDFFGVVTVTRSGPTYRLFHGSTLHGEQDRDRPREPLTYFSREGPIGDLMRVPRGAGAHVAVVGLGVGSLAAYASQGDRWDFFEIDPAIARVATSPRYFTFLSESGGEITLVLGDARLRLREAEGPYDLIVLDAFSSDAPPVHLLTLEAFDLYESKLAGHGRIAVNLTNRYLDLEAVLAAMVGEKGWACRVRRDVEISAARKALGHQGSIWAVVARGEADLGPLTDDPRWAQPRPSAGVRAWTDQSADLARPFLSRLRGPR